MNTIDKQEAVKSLISQIYSQYHAAAQKPQHTSREFQI